MAGRYQCGIRDIVKQVEQEQSLNHGGRFEWVDSILVQCLQDGDWLLIENVNFCRFVCKRVCNSCTWLMQITIGVKIRHYIWFPFTCSDTVGWATGMAFIQPIKIVFQLSSDVLFLSA